MTLSESVVETHLAALWETSIIPSISDYIRIPALSKNFDPEWRSSGHIDAAATLLTGWANARQISGMHLDVVEIEGLTPVILITVEPFGPDVNDSTVLLYGHLDKQPEMTGWRSDLGPWKPVREGDKLYGRGGADDGYAIYAALGAIEACQRAGGSHSRLIVLIESCEESGSPDLPAYIDKYSDFIGIPSLVVCLDSGCDDYIRLWTTTSLRGLVALNLTVKVVTVGVHSGVASGVVPSSMRIIRQLLNRIEDAETGEILMPELHSEIPVHRVAEASVRAAALEPDVRSWFPFEANTQPMAIDAAEAILATTWRPTLSYIGVDGIPSAQAGGNVLRPSTTMRLSFRLPPNVYAPAAAAALTTRLLADSPYNATVIVDHVESATGWDAPPTAPWLAQAAHDSGLRYFGAAPASLGEGGSIPFMNMLGRKFPEAQFFVIGLAGPDAGAHGPDEFLHLPMAEKLSCCVASVLDAHARSAH